MYDDRYNDDKYSLRRYPKVPIDRRMGAFAIDFVTVWLVSSFFAANLILQSLVFFLGWLALRVILVDKNQGQSLGRWALDLKVIAPRFNRIPDLLSLGKREGILGLAATLAMYGLQINFRNGLSMLLLISPLLVDCAFAFVDEQLNLAFHDRIAQTAMTQTQRGFSLDLRLKKIFVQIKRNMRR